jgi:hypothetical protein
MADLIHLTGRREDEMKIDLRDIGWEVYIGIS